MNRWDADREIGIINRIPTRIERDRIPAHLDQDGKINEDNKLHQQHSLVILESPGVTHVDSWETQ